MTTHLRLNCFTGYDEHPQQTMKRLGITYQHATPQSMGDQWWFWNCENIPNPLPEHFSVLDCENPFEMVGWGLSEEDAKNIKGYMSENCKCEEPILQPQTKQCGKCKLYIDRIRHIQLDSNIKTKK